MTMDATSITAIASQSEAWYTIAPTCRSKKKRTFGAGILFMAPPKGSSTDVDAIIDELLNSLECQLLGSLT